MYILGGVRGADRRHGAANFLSVSLPFLRREVFMKQDVLATAPSISGVSANI